MAAESRSHSAPIGPRARAGRTNPLSVLAEASACQHAAQLAEELSALPQPYRVVSRVACPAAPAVMKANAR
eukprot:195948-Pleurochrysis_carterae.AAC.5